MALSCSNIPVRKMLLVTLFSLILLQFGSCIDTLNLGKPLIEYEKLTSKSGKFTLGFFSPAKSTRRYIGIWFTKVSEQTVVWVANRENPIINGSLGVLSIEKDGNLKISSQEKVVIWSTNVSIPISSNDNIIINNRTSSHYKAQLLDSGNLVVSSIDGREVVWQSFDYPTDTLLSGMKLGLDKRTGLERFLTSWKSKDDPSAGTYTGRIDPHGTQFILYEHRGLDSEPEPVWQTGPWIGKRWSGLPIMASAHLFTSEFVNNQEEISFSMFINNDVIMAYGLLDGSSGTFGWRMWNEDARQWISMWYAPQFPCDQYGKCGDFGSCNTNNNGSQYECTCLLGYVPKSPPDGLVIHGKQRCVRENNNTTSMCRNREGFLKLASVNKLPDTSKAVINISMTLKECEKECLKNCSCLAYSTASFDDHSGETHGCILYGQLMDTITYASGGPGSQDLYLRVDAVELAKYLKSKGRRLAIKRAKEVLIVFAALTFTICLTFACVWAFMKKKREWEEANERTLWTKGSEESDANSEVTFFSRSEIVAATHNFSSANKLGQGGFGSVYKQC